jgi:alpha-beta hydrolase superfamily lysophospholipase
MTCSDMPTIYPQNTPSISPAWQESTFSFQTIDNHSLTVVVWQRPQGETILPTTRRVMLFIPGLGGSVDHAKPVLDPLIASVDAIISVDCRSFGRNKGVPLYDVAEIYADLQLFIETVLPNFIAEQLIQPTETIIAGISLGGLMATYLANKFQQQFEKVVLFVPAFKPNMAVFPLTWVVPNLLKLAFTKNKKAVSVWLPYGVDAITRNPDYLNGTLPAPEVPLYLSLNFLKTVKDWQGKRLKNTLNSLKQSVFLCVAEQDKVSSTPEMKRLFFEQLPPKKSHKLLSLPDAFHDVFLEPEAPWIAEALAHWLVHPETHIAVTQRPQPIGMESFN